MPDDDQMTLDERYRYLRRLHQRYDGADRPTLSKLLDEAVAVTGLNRKYLCHLWTTPAPFADPAPGSEAPTTAPRRSIPWRWWRRRWTGSAPSGCSPPWPRPPPIWRASGHSP
ncbi:MAG: hypothetical protein ACYC5M_16460 [Anaerolineae bacterium]